MISPWIVGGAVGGAALLGYGLMRKIKTSKLPTAAVLKSAYDAGKSSGELDGTADAGKAHNPRGLLNYSDVPAVQTQYDNGYNDGYEAKWTAPAKTPDVVMDSTPSAGGKSDKISAYDYGCSRGTSSGKADGSSGADSSWGYNLETAGSKKRQAESGNAADYREGYKKCYIAAYAVAYAAKGTLAESEGKLGKDELGIDWFSVSGLAQVGRLKARAPLWAGGQRVSVGAVSKTARTAYVDGQLQVTGT